MRQHNSLKESREDGANSVRRREKRLKIAFLNPLIAGQGGVETVLVNLIQGLEREGDECRLYIVGGTRYDGWLKDIRWSREIKSNIKPRALRLLGYLSEVVHELRAWQPDVIVACDTTMVRLGRWAAFLAGIRGMPILCWLHCSYKYQKMQIEVARADANLCICKERADEVEEYLQQEKRRAAGPARIFLVYSGTGAGSRPAIPRAAVATFVFVGRIQYESTKRIKDLIEAAAQLEGEFRIKLLGDGYDEEKNKIKARAEELGIADRIEWLGWQMDSWNAVSEASAMVLPSDSEGFSMVTIEALSLGLPVVLADFGGISKEAVVPGKTGWMFPVADAPALARILQPIVDDPTGLPDPESIRSFARRFSTEQMITDFQRAAREVLAKR